jgi:hypothetical protein
LTNEKIVLELQKELELLRSSSEEKELVIHNLEERIEILVTEIESLKNSNEDMAKTHQK